MMKERLHINVSNIRAFFQGEWDKTEFQSFFMEIGGGVIVLLGFSFISF